MTGRSAPGGDSGESVGRGVGTVGLVVGLFVGTCDTDVSGDMKVSGGVIAGPGCVSRTLSIEPLTKMLSAR